MRATNRPPLPLRRRQATAMVIITIRDTRRRHRIATSTRSINNRASDTGATGVVIRVSILVLV